MHQTKLERINQIERQVLVHSYLYYALDTNIISDPRFDEIMEALLPYKYSPEFKESAYYKDFLDFDGSTGMDLPYRNPEIVNIGQRLLRIQQEKRKQGDY